VFVFWPKDGTKTGAFTLGINGLALTFKDCIPDDKSSLVSVESSIASQESGVLSSSIKKTSYRSVLYRENSFKNKKSKVFVEFGSWN
jgi:hypothetical protein